MEARASYTEVPGFGAEAGAARLEAPGQAAGAASLPLLPQLCGPPAGGLAPLCGAAQASSLLTWHARGVELELRELPLGAEASPSGGDSLRCGPFRAQLLGGCLAADTAEGALLVTLTADGGAHGLQLHPTSSGRLLSSARAWHFADVSAALARLDRRVSLLKQPFS